MARASLANAAATTIPLAQQNPTTALFTATGIFQSCLSNLGVTFVGAPNPSNPSSPANNPGYLKNLVTCATKSNILQALKAVQSAQDNLTPSQVKKENKDYLKWRKCMIARGWGIPQPTPNAKGLLFSFGGTGGGSGGSGGGRAARRGSNRPPGRASSTAATCSNARRSRNRADSDQPAPGDGYGNGQPSRERRCPVDKRQ